MHLFTQHGRKMRASINSSICKSISFGPELQFYIFSCKYSIVYKAIISTGITCKLCSRNRILSHRSFWNGPNQKGNLYDFHLHFYSCSMPEEKKIGLSVKHPNPYPANFIQNQHHHVAVPALSKTCPHLLVRTGKSAIDWTCTMQPCPCVPE